MSKLLEGEIAELVEEEVYSVEEELEGSSMQSNDCASEHTSDACPEA